MKTDVELSAWSVTPRQLARDADVSLGLVYRMLADGTLVATKIDGEWKIAESAASAYLLQRRCRQARASAPVGRRTRCTS